LQRQKCQTKVLPRTQTSAQEFVPQNFRKLGKLEKVKYTWDEGRDSMGMVIYKSV
jgi:hypothetical protein